jgi:DNA-binding CsgD family transcriptional regulator
LADSVALPASQAQPKAAAQPDSLILGGSGSLAGDLDGDLGLGDAIGQGESIYANDQSGQDDLARTMLGTGPAVGGLDAMELDLDSIVGLSSPSVAAPSAVAKSGQPAASAKIGPPGSGTFNVELSGVDIGSQPSNAAGSNATGSLVLGSGALGSGALGSGALGSGALGPDAVGSGVDLGGLSGSLINAGAALSGALDSGLSLEDDDAAISGIDLGSLDESQAAEDGATALAGDEFELGGLTGDDDSASVVAVEPESGDSSFFATGGGESSEFTGDIPLGAEAAGDMGDLSPGGVVPDTKFSVWQICGLVCCALLLLTGGFVMFVLMRTIDQEPSRGGERVDPMARLSQRERQVAQAVVRGRARSETAKELLLQPGTIATLTKRIYRKLGVTNRLELARCFSNLPALTANETA